MEEGSQDDSDSWFSIIASASHFRDIQEMELPVSAALPMKRKQRRHRSHDSVEVMKTNQDTQEEAAGSEVYGKDKVEDEYRNHIYCGGRNKRKREKTKAKNRGFGSFIIEEADESDGLEEEEEWEDGAEELSVVSVNAVSDVGQTAQGISDGQRGGSFLDLENEAEIEEYFKQKYAHSSTGHYGDGADEESIEEITQQSLLPTAKDARLWKLKCRKGEEKSTAMHLMRKCLALAGTDPMQIISALAPEAAKGFIYIEARNKSHIIDAVAGIRNLQGGIWKQELIPINEMVDVLRVKKLQQALQPKQWVRVKRGTYKGDIAQIDHIVLGEKKVHLKLLPRVDYVRNGNVCRKKPRLAAKPFDPEKARAVGNEVVLRDDFWHYKGNRYSREGYLHKAFPIDSTMTEGVVPTLLELENFMMQGPDQMLDYSGVVSADLSKVKFTAGDMAEVRAGDLQKLQLKVTTVDGLVVTGLPTYNQLKEELTFLATEVQKVFNVGDHVKVCAGRFMGETGIVVKVNPSFVILISDLTMNELEVLPQDLSLCIEMGAGVDSSGRFMWGDLVMLNSEIAGVVIRLAKDVVHVLSMHGNVVGCVPSSLHAVNKYRNKTGLDCQQNMIKRNDIVKVVDGLHHERQGEIKHLYRNMVFLYSRSYSNNAGFFPVLMKSVCLGELNPALNAHLPVMFSPVRSLSNSNGEGRLKLLGKTIKIIAGAYKGSVGYVRCATNVMVRVVLHSSGQSISVLRDHVSVIGEALPNNNAMSFVSQNTDYYGSQTPFYDSEKKIPFGSETPSPLNTGELGNTGSTVDNTSIDFNKESMQGGNATKVQGSISDGKQQYWSTTSENSESEKFGTD